MRRLFTRLVTVLAFVIAPMLAIASPMVSPAWLSGKLDDENFRSIIEHLCNRNLTPVTAKPTPTSVMPNFYHLLEKGENKILDEKNRQYNLEV